MGSVPFYFYRVNSPELCRGPRITSDNLQFEDDAISREEAW